MVSFFVFVPLSNTLEVVKRLVFISDARGCLGEHCVDVVDCCHLVLKHHRDCVVGALLSFQ